MDEYLKDKKPAPKKAEARESEGIKDAKFEKSAGTKKDEKAATVLKAE